MVQPKLGSVLKSEGCVTWNPGDGDTNSGLVGILGPCHFQSHPDLSGQCFHIELGEKERVWQVGWMDMWSGLGRIWRGKA